MLVCDEAPSNTMTCVPVCDTTQALAWWPSRTQASRVGIGSLLVGLSTAKALAFTRGLPLVCVDHVEAHVYAATMDRDESLYPALALVVSGGHTNLFRADSPLEITPLVGTILRNGMGPSMARM